MIILLFNHADRNGCSTLQAFGCLPDSNRRKAWWSCFKRRQTTNYLWYTVILTGAWAAPSLDSNLVVLTKRGVHQIIQGRAPAFRLRVGQILACDSEAWKSLTHQLYLPSIWRHCLWTLLYQIEVSSDLTHRASIKSQIAKGRISNSEFFPAKDFCVVLTIWRQARPHSNRLPLWTTPTQLEYAP
jgi:hypothetical protein